jgi:AraC-like DNA-binding protein
MYNPVKDGIKKEERLVKYTEVQPPIDLSGLVHCFWELKTHAVLAEDFHLHVIPDACINVLFNILDPRIAAITARQTTYVELNLGKSFHYVGIQFLPGMWQGKRDEILYGFVDKPYTGKLPLTETANQLGRVDFASMQAILTDFVRLLIDRKLVVENPITTSILEDIDEIETVAEMAAAANLSTRQLQRILKNTTGFSPHDLLKVLRLQLSFRNHYLEYYTDQSHFIHSFRKITGYTPAEFFKSFHV